MISKLGGAASRNEVNASLKTGTDRVRARIEGISCNFCKMELDVAINRSGSLSSCISPDISIKLIVCPAWRTRKRGVHCSRHVHLAETLKVTEFTKLLALSASDNDVDKLVAAS